MKKTLLFLFVFLFFLSSCSDDDKDDEVQLDENNRITNVPARNQAFTDLVYFDNQFFLTFRDSDKHAYGEDGTIKIMNSKDGKNWTLIKEIAIARIDLRDPKFSVNGENLMLYIHGSTFQGNIVLSFSDYRLKYSNNWNTIENVTLDNRQTTTSKISGNEVWPWRVTWHKGIAYSVGYNGFDLFGIYKSKDGLFFNNAKNFNTISNLPTEATIRVNKKDELYILSRRNNGTTFFGKYDDLHNELKVLGEIPFTNFGGPNFLFLNEKQILFSGKHNGSVVLAVYDIDRNTTKILTSFGLGDCSYPGMLIKDGYLWLSYYSASSLANVFETSIYVAKIKIKESY
jgi:hypothetical protein